MYDTNSQDWIGFHSGSLLLLMEFTFCPSIQFAYRGTPIQGFVPRKLASSERNQEYHRYGHER